MSGSRPYFYNKTIRNYTTIFGNLFNSISIVRKDDGDATVGTHELPIAFAPKQKFLVRLNQESSIDNSGTQTKMTLPRLGFNLVDMIPDSTRKRNPLQKRILTDGNDPDNISWKYEPVPWDFTYELYIMTKNYDDGMQVIEQILPFFNPSVNIPVKDDSNFDQFHDISILFEGISSEVDYEGDFETRRALIWTLTFTVKGYMYGDTKNSGLIQQVEAYTKDLDCDIDYQNITVTPDPVDSGPEDDYGFDVSIDEDFSEA